MDTAIHIGNKVDKTTTDNLTDIVKTIFEVGYACHMDQDTIQEALNMVSTVTEVKQVTLSGCNIIGDKVINVSHDGDDEV